MLINHYREFYNPVLFKLFPRVPLHNTKYVRVPLGTANINVYFQDIGLPGCFANAAETSNLAVATFLI
jgi:hypothetical protein